MSNEKIKEAIRLLRDNGYIVKKLRKIQKEDANKCASCGFNGDCSSCSCSICIMQ